MISDIVRESDKKKGVTTGEVGVGVDTRESEIVLFLDRSHRMIESF